MTLKSVVCFFAHPDDETILAGGIIALLASQGIALPEKPRHAVPALPEDPTALSDSELMSQFSATQAWAEFQSVQLAAAMVSEKFAEEALAKHRAIAAVANKTEKTVTAAKARAYEDPEFEAAIEAEIKAYSYRKMIESIYNNTERKAAVLSREITRRVGRNDRESRGNRWQA